MVWPCYIHGGRRRHNVSTVAIRRDSHGHRAFPCYGETYRTSANQAHELCEVNQKYCKDSEKGLPVQMRPAPWNLVIVLWGSFKAFFWNVATGLRGKPGRRSRLCADVLRLLLTLGHPCESSGIVHGRIQRIRYDVREELLNIGWLMRSKEYYQICRLEELSDDIRYLTTCVDMEFCYGVSKLNIHAPLNQQETLRCIPSMEAYSAPSSSYNPIAILGTDRMLTGRSYEEL